MITMTELCEIGKAALGDSIYPNPLYPPSPYYRVLRRFAERLKPKVAVELGVCGGGGSLHLALGNPDGAVIGVDFAYDHPEQLEHIGAVCKNFHFHLGKSTESAKEIYDTYGPIDFLFIDTDHTYDTTMAEYLAFLPYLSDFAVVCFDDLFRPGMKEAWDNIPEPKERMDFMHPGEYPHGGCFGVHINPSMMIPNGSYLLGC